MTTEDTLEDTDYQFLAAAGYNLYPMHDSLRLLDAHLIFEPLLSSLGVMPQQMISNLSGAGLLFLFRHILRMKLYIDQVYFLLFCTMLVKELY